MLAESGLKRRSRHATATLLIGANLPDIDAVAGFWGSDVELHVRRGHTHGILAMLVLPLLLTGAMWLWQRWRGGAAAGAARAGATDADSSDRPGDAPFRPRAILALAFLGIWSHPLLDWMNTYGVRLLMPFDDRWFYGDTLFIIDPWVWLVAAAGVVLAHSITRRAIAGWTLLATLASALVLSTSLVPSGVKVGWCSGVALIIALRWWQPAWSENGRIARAGLTVLVAHVLVAYGLARHAETRAAARFPSAAQVQANPMPGVPHSHRVVVVEETAYRIVATDGVVHDVPRPPADSVVQAALASPSIRGFANWTRFPAWTIEESSDHWVVRFRDLRYQGPDVPESRGIGQAEVRVPKSAPGPGSGAVAAP